MNRDYWSKPIQHSRSAHDYGNSGPIEPMRRGSVWSFDYKLTMAIVFMGVIAWVSL